MGTFILNEHGIAIPCNDYVEWSTWMATASRCIKQTNIENLVISTVFLGLDHQYGAGDPLLFETMIFEDEDFGNPVSFGPEAEDEIEEEVRQQLSSLGFNSRRYSFIGDAIKGHEEAREEILARVSTAQKATLKITEAITKYSVDE